MATRYRAEHVGSFLRPQEVLKARAAYALGEIPLEELRRVEDRAVQQALDVQHDTGIDVYSDGEMRRGSFLSDLAESVEGFVPDTVSMEWHGPTEAEGPEGSVAQVVGSKLRRMRRLTAHEAGYL